MFLLKRSSQKNILIPKFVIDMFIIISNRIYNKILDHDWFSVHLFVM